MNLFAGQQWRCGHREQTYGRRGREEGEGGTHGHVCTTTCETDSRGGFAGWVRELRSGLCDDLEGWDGLGGEREVQEGGDICISMAGSCWCMDGRNQYCGAITFQLKNKWIKKISPDISKMSPGKHDLPPLRTTGIEPAKPWYQDITMII